MTNPDWTTPATDGWHWLRWKDAPLFSIASFYIGNWTIYTPDGAGLSYDPEDLARCFDYIGPIPEPGSHDRLVECLERAAVTMEETAQEIRAEWEPRIADGFKNEADKRLGTADVLERIAAEARALIKEASDANPE